MRNLIYFLCAVTLISCDEPDKKTLFENLPPEQTGINFRNDLTFDKEFNIYTYRNFYNGGGVGAADVNNDGLTDLYFTSNQGENKLYLNKGNFKFEDITKTAKVGGTKAWSTGVSMADVNGDGWIDIFVCNSGDIKNDKRETELFINNGDLTFTERAREYGLADKGYSTHAAFFDYDKDGDLDVYLLNNSFQAIGSFNLMKNIRHERDSLGGDKLFRNDDNKFVDVSEQAGIYGSVIGFGLGVTVGDVNNDNWMDIYVSNDFFERDYLYLNNHDGTFKEILTQSMPSISAASMGADMADINNDGWLDVFVTDMLPNDDKRLKQVTTFENWDKLQYNYKNGYHHQYNRNMLHLNNGNNTFSEIGRLVGVEATDWSWGALFFDMDNDGYKDIFVANGIYQDITDLDYLSFIVDENTVKRIISNQGVDYKALIDPIPSNSVPNFAFKNQGNLSFANKAEEWGLSDPVHSNGSVYADLDNDGTLDLVVNNVNDFARVYKNAGRSLIPSNHFIRIELKGSGRNTRAIGTRVEAVAGNEKFYLEQMPTRGFQSSVDPTMVMGLGKHDLIDELKLTWPDGSTTTLRGVKADQTIKIAQSEANIEKNVVQPDTVTSILTDITDSHVLDFAHKENEFVDFDRDRLLFHMLSTQGPALAKGDVNNDGLEDVFLGGAKGQAGQLFLQQASGSFRIIANPAFDESKNSEDVDAVLFDADNDKDLDLYVASGGNEFALGVPELEDRLYLNDGAGRFSRSRQPVFGSNRNIKGAVAATDFDRDGDIDLFVGVRAKPFNYGMPADGFIYENDGAGMFIDVTRTVAPELKGIGLISDGIWTDIDNDKDDDLIIVGDWMAIEVFKNDAGSLTRITSELELEGYTGWWNTISPADIDNDGDTDYILGNQGLNSRFRASVESPVMLYLNDYDKNGSIEHIFAKKVGDKIVPYALKHDLIAQIPELKKKYLKYKDYNDKSLTDIFRADQLKGAVILNAKYLASCVLINDGGKFQVNMLPVQAQFSSVYSILPGDYDGDGKLDLLLGGNLYETKPQEGRYDASYGLMLKGSGDGAFTALSPMKSGVNINGAIRKMVKLPSKPDKILVALNNDTLRVLKITRDK